MAKLLGNAFNTDQKLRLKSVSQRIWASVSLLMTVVQENGGLGTYCMLGANLASGHHNDRFDFDESVLSTGLELLVKTVSALQE